MELGDPVSQSSQMLVAKEVVICEAKDVERADDPSEVCIANWKTEVVSKGKNKIFNENASVSDPGNSTSVAGSVDGLVFLKNSTSESIYLDNSNSQNSDLSYQDEYEDLFFDDNFSDYGYDEDDYTIMQLQFDNVDLPTGIEVPIPWLKEAFPTENTTCGLSSSSIPDLAESKRKAAVQDLADSKRKAKISSLNLAESKLVIPCTSSSTAQVESSSREIEENGIAENLKGFKQFDIVEDFSDHHYRDLGFLQQQPPKKWAKRVQEEWAMLEKGLPDTIFVRAYEARMDLLRAVVIGPSGTPYHHGLFVFDCLFPCRYPDEPPMVYYYSGGLRLNPNLYECGKVCLSLLGTWGGQQTEMWIPGKSTMLQVLVSIQALILNAKPFFNEPGYEMSYTGEKGEKKSKQYNEDAFIKSLKTMIYTLRKPPKHFEDFVALHFRAYARQIMIACKAYTEGVTVGSIVVGDAVQSVDSIKKDGSKPFGKEVGKMMNLLAKIFTKNGSTDCDQLLTPTINSREADQADGH